MRLYVIRSGTVRGEGDYLVDTHIGHRLWSTSQAHARLWRARDLAEQAISETSASGRVVRLRRATAE